MKNILALLQERFVGMRQDGLEQLARSIALQPLSSEDQRKAYIDKLPEEAVGAFVKEFRRVVDKEVSESNKTSIENLKKKYSFVEKKAKPSTASEQEMEHPEQTGGGAQTEVSKLIQTVQALQEKLEGLERGRVTATRRQALEETLKGCRDETFKAQSLKDFSRMSFQTDEAFSAYLQEKQEDVKTANQNMANLQLRDSATAPHLAQRNSGGIMQAVSEYIESQQPEANILTGKTIA